MRAHMLSKTPKSNERERLIGRLGFLMKPSQEKVVLLVTIILGIIFSFILERFATVGNMLAMLRSMSILGILALGMGIVVIARGLDLSQIVAMAATAAIALQLMTKGMSIPMSLIWALPFAISLGLFNGFFIAYVEVPALFTTLASGFMAYGFARSWLIDFILQYPPSNATGFLFLGQGRILGIPLPIYIFVISSIVVHFLLSKTVLGLYIYAQGDNYEAARLSGIPVRVLTLVEYILCSLIGYFAGIILTSSAAIMNTQIIYSTMIFDVVLVVVLGGISLIGGRGSVWSVVVGVLLISVLLNGLTMANLSTMAQNICKGIVLLGAILLDNRLHPVDEETARQGDIL